MYDEYVSTRFLFFFFLSPSALGPVLFFCEGKKPKTEGGQGVSEGWLPQSETVWTHSRGLRGGRLLGRGLRGRSL
jgi:hypothetical protein